MHTEPTAPTYEITVCPDCAQTHQMTACVPGCGPQMVKQGRNLWRCSNCGFKGAYVPCTVVSLAIVTTRETSYQQALVDVLDALDPKTGTVTEQWLQKARNAAGRMLTDEGCDIRYGKGEG